MKGSTAYNWQEKFLVQIKDIYSCARMFGWSQDEILKHLDERVYSKPAWNKVPQYVRSYLVGWMRCQYDQLYRWHLQWMLSIDGKLMTTEEVDALTRKEATKAFSKKPDYRSPRARCDMGKSCHVWVDNKGKPRRDKPY